MTSCKPVSSCTETAPASQLRHSSPHQCHCQAQHQHCVVRSQHYTPSAWKLLTSSSLYGRHKTRPCGPNVKIAAASASYGPGRDLPPQAAHSPDLQSTMHLFNLLPNHLSKTTVLLSLLLLLGLASCCPATPSAHHMCPEARPGAAHLFLQPTWNLLSPVRVGLLHRRFTSSLPAQQQQQLKQRQQQRCSNNNATTG